MRCSRKKQRRRKKQNRRKWLEGRALTGSPFPAEISHLNFIEITGREIASHPPRSDRRTTVFNIFPIRPRSGVI